MIDLGFIQEPNMTINIRTDNESQGRSKRYAILKPRLRHVPQDVVRLRWDVVPQPVHDRIRELLKLIEMPVVMGQGIGRTGTAAQVAVTSVLRTWVTRVLLQKYHSKSPNALIRQLRKTAFENSLSARYKGAPF